MYLPDCSDIYGLKTALGSLRYHAEHNLLSDDYCIAFETRVADMSDCYVISESEEESLRRLLKLLKLAQHAG